MSAYDDFEGTLSDLIRLWVYGSDDPLDAAKEYLFPGVDSVSDQALLRAIANLVDEYTIMLPRDPSGVPIRFGDNRVSWVAGDSHSEDDAVLRFNALLPGMVPASIESGEVVAVGKVDTHGRVMRSDPVELDINGVRIHPGDTVTSVARGCKYKVLNVGGGRVICEAEDGSMISRFPHALRKD